MSKAICRLVFLAILSLGNHAMAEPLGFVERYALAEDREAVLAELIPGSEDYFFFHCLHYQTTGQLEKAEAILKDWLAHHKGRPNQAIHKMTDRQRLLTYGDSPRTHRRLPHPTPEHQTQSRAAGRPRRAPVSKSA